MAVIYDEHKADYAAALYHYEKARRRRPDAYPADIARDRVEVGKRELAKTVTQTPTMDYMQREIDRLMLENQRLRHPSMDRQNYYQGRSRIMPAGTTRLPLASPAGSAPATSAPALTRLEPERPRSDGPPAGRAPPPGSPGSATAATRTHKVAAGDNPAKIAARYGIKVGALRAANPGLDDRRLRVGQTLVIPRPRGGLRTLHGSKGNEAAGGRRPLKHAQPGNSKAVGRSQFR